MDACKSDEPPPPQSNDLAGWKLAVANGTFRQFRLEEIVAAIQDLWPHTDKVVLHALAKHLSDSMINILRDCVYFSHANHGQDIIDRVHSQLWEALLQPKSADGKGLRLAFGPRLKFRLKDAIAVEARGFRSPDEYSVGGSKKGKKSKNTDQDTERTIGSLSEHLDEPHDAGDSDDDSSPSKRTSRCADHGLLERARIAEEERHVESVLRLITDDRKRLAFRLFMDGVPYKSLKSHSIAAALDISEKTAREWIKEVQVLLKSKMGDNT